jgi:uncharacterized protein YndB with AHSA1/START domain
MAADIHVVQSLAASRESIWRAISDARSIARWQADAASGGLSQGGFVLKWPSLGAELALDVAAAEPEQRLVLRNGDTFLELHVEDGRLELWHRGLLPDDDLEGMRASWQVSLGVLAHYLAHHEGQDRHVHWVARPVATNAELAHVFFTDAAALSSWLTRGDGGIGDLGDAFACTSHWGATLRGRVLVRQPGRDVAVCLAEPEPSVLVFRTLPSPLTDAQRLVALVWSRWGAAAPSPLPGQLSGALGRLKLVLEGVGGA